MFGRPVESWDDMREALAAPASGAAEKVRKHGLVANAMQVFFHTHPHNDEGVKLNVVDLTFGVL